MVTEYRATDWDSYKMQTREPHRVLEPVEREIEVVQGCLGLLVDAGIIPHADYDHDRFLAHRRAVADLFEIPWTAITPRMQRLLYAISAIAQPQVMLAAGVFCGNTFISNAGAAVGPGGVYAARDLVGLEIKADEAERAERNVRRIDPTGIARVLAADALEFVRDYPDTIDLLYLDADGGPEEGKGIYLRILEAGLDRMNPGGIVLAHNSVNCAAKLSAYLAFVRDEGNCTSSVNAIVDPEGLEVSVI